MGDRIESTPISTPRMFAFSSSVTAWRRSTWPISCAMTAASSSSDETVFSRPMSTWTKPPGRANALISSELMMWKLYVMSSRARYFARFDPMPLTQFVRNGSSTSRLSRSISWEIAPPLDISVAVLIAKAGTDDATLHKRTADSARAARRITDLPLLTGDRCQIVLQHVRCHEAAVHLHDLTVAVDEEALGQGRDVVMVGDRKSTRLNSSHV